MRFAWVSVMRKTKEKASRSAHAFNKRQERVATFLWTYFHHGDTALIVAFWSFSVMKSLDERE